MGVGYKPLKRIINNQYTIFFFGIHDLLKILEDFFLSDFDFHLNLGMRETNVREKDGVVYINVKAKNVTMEITARREEINSDDKIVLEVQKTSVNSYFCHKIMDRIYDYILMSFELDFS